MELSSLYHRTGDAGVKRRRRSPFRDFDTPALQAYRDPDAPGRTFTDLDAPTPRKDWQRDPSPDPTFEKYVEVDPRQLDARPSAGNKDGRARSTMPAPSRRPRTVQTPAVAFGESQRVKGAADVHAASLKRQRSDDGAPPTLARCERKVQAWDRARREVEGKADADAGVMKKKPLQRSDDNHAGALARATDGGLDAYRRTTRGGRVDNTPHRGAARGRGRGRGRGEGTSYRAGARGGGRGDSKLYRGAAVRGRGRGDGVAIRSGLRDEGRDVTPSASIGRGWGGGAQASSRAGRLQGTQKGASRSFDSVGTSKHTVSRPQTSADGHYGGGGLRADARLDSASRSAGYLDQGGRTEDRTDRSLGVGDRSVRNSRQDRSGRDLRKEGRPDRELRREERSDRDVRREDRSDRDLRREDRSDRDLRREDRSDRDLRMEDHFDRELRREDRSDRKLGREDRPNRDSRRANRSDYRSEPDRFSRDRRTAQRDYREGATTNSTERRSKDSLEGDRLGESGTERDRTGKSRHADRTRMYSAAASSVADGRRYSKYDEKANDDTRRAVSHELTGARNKRVRRDESNERRAVSHDGLMDERSIRGQRGEDDARRAASHDGLLSKGDRRAQSKSSTPPVEIDAPHDGDVSTLDHISFDEWREFREYVYSYGSDEDNLALKLLREVILSPTTGMPIDALSKLSEVLASIGVNICPEGKVPYVDISQLPDSLQKTLEPDVFSTLRDSSAIPNSVRAEAASERERELELADCGAATPGVEQDAMMLFADALRHSFEDLGAEGMGVTGRERLFRGRPNGIPIGRPGYMIETGQLPLFDDIVVQDHLYTYIRQNLHPGYIPPIDKSFKKV